MTDTHTDTVQRLDPFSGPPEPELDLIGADGDDPTDHLTPAELAEVEKLARIWQGYEAQHSAAEHEKRLRLNE